MGDKNLGYIFERNFGTDKTDYIVFVKELEADSVRVSKCYGAKILSSIMGSMEFFRFNFAVDAFRTELTGLQHRFHLTLSFGEGKVEADTKSVNCIVYFLEREKGM